MKLALVSKPIFHEKKSNHYSKNPRKINSGYPETALVDFIKWL
jgi:hypothetical protein